MMRLQLYHPSVEDSNIHISSDPLIPEDVINVVSKLNSGAVNVFIGRVRDQTNKKKVLRLEYEAYEKMAVSEIGKIIRKAETNWNPISVAVHHRVGILNPGDLAVVIAVCTPHRKESFEACEFMIDTLKKSVPIWKKEIFEDGEVWVSAHP